MLELTRPYGTDVRPYLAPSTATWVASEAWELRAYYALRREIFAREQQLFHRDDRDHQDATAIPIVAVSLVAGMPDEIVGVVRIYETSVGQGDVGQSGVETVRAGLSASASSRGEPGDIGPSWQVHRALVAPHRLAKRGSGVWYGGRLGVKRRYRRQASIGAALIRTAVTTAHARGCERFLATVQASNVPYFMNQHFTPLKQVTVCGTAHYLMSADLRYFPPDDARPMPPPDRLARLRKKDLGHEA